MAPRRPSSVKNSRADRRASVKSGKKDNAESTSKEPLKLEDVGCPICFSVVMIEPVTLPCHHHLCHSCFKDLVEKSNLTCPHCRKFIGGFSRQASKNKNAVNEDLWSRIQLEFPQQVKLELEKSDENVEPEDFPVVAIHQLAEPGDLLKEFEREQEVLQRLEEERKQKEEMASAAILAQLEKEQAEELARAAELERIRLADEALALELSGHQDHLAEVRSSPVTLTPPSTRKRPRKSSESAKYTPAAKKISTFFSNRFVGNENDEPAGISAFASVSGPLPKCNDVLTSEARSSSGTSSGSIDVELTNRLHFRPINAAPLTPPKQSPNSGQIVHPQVVPAMAAKNLNLLNRDEGENSDANHNVSSNRAARNAEPGSLAAELVQMEREWLRKKLEQEEADREMARKLQEQLDAEQRPRPVVNRSKGTKDEYLLRAKKRPDKKQSTIEDSFQRPGNRKSFSP